MKKIYLMTLVAISVVLSGCDNQAKQREIEKQRQEDSIRVAENVKKELAEKEAKEKAEREKQEAEEKERIEQEGFYTSVGGPLSIKKVIELAYQDGVRGGGLCNRYNNPNFAGHGTEAYFKNWWTNSFGIPDNEKAKEVYNKALQEYLRGYNEGINF